MNRLWVLGRDDAEMKLIAEILQRSAQNVICALGPGRSRIKPGDRLHPIALDAIAARCHVIKDVDEVALVKCDCGSPGFDEQTRLLLSLKIGIRVITITDSDHETRCISRIWKMLYPEYEFPFSAELEVALID